MVPLPHSRGRGATPTSRTVTPLRRGGTVRFPPPPPPAGSWDPRALSRPPISGQCPPVHLSTLVHPLRYLPFGSAWFPPDLGVTTPHTTPPHLVKAPPPPAAPRYGPLMPGVCTRHVPPFVTVCPGLLPRPLYLDGSSGAGYFVGGRTPEPTASPRPTPRVLFSPPRWLG